MLTLWVGGVRWSAGKKGEWKEAPFQGSDRDIQKRLRRPHQPLRLEHPPPVEMKHITGKTSDKLPDTVRSNEESEIESTFVTSTRHWADASNSVHIHRTPGRSGRPRPKWKGDRECMIGKIHKARCAPPHKPTKCTTSDKTM